MSRTLQAAKPLIEWHVAAQPARGESVSGDLHLVQPFRGGLLVAVLDGVGHGDEATVAARTAVEVLKRHAQDSVISLIRRCHEALLKTRGVVMTVASVRAAENMLTWIGVGNVEGRVLRAEAGHSHPAESLLLRGGVVGYHLPALQASILPVCPGDLLIFASDGVYPGFDTTVGLGAAPRQIAEHVLQRYAKGTDDALVLVARYLGKAPGRNNRLAKTRTQLNPHPTSNSYVKDSYIIG